MTTIFVAAAVAATLGTAPPAGAQSPTVPQCTDTGGAQAIGGSTTECVTPGNVSINATPAQTQFLYPWADEFYGPALIIGGGGGFHGGGHGGR